MINSVSNVGFRGVNNAQDLINSPGVYSNSIPDMPADSLDISRAEMPQEKKSNTGVIVLVGTLIAGLAAFAGLGYAVKSGKLAKVEVPTEGMFAKAWAHVKNAGVTVGESAGKCWDTVAGWFGRGSKKAADATENAA